MAYDCPCLFSISRIADVADILSNTVSAHEQHSGLLSVFKGGEKHPADALAIMVDPQTASPLKIKRMVLLKAPIREDRNYLLSALRTLISVSQNRKPEEATPTSARHSGMMKSTPQPSSFAVPGKESSYIDPCTSLEVRQTLYPQSLELFISVCSSSSSI